MISIGHDGLTCCILMLNCYWSGCSTCCILMLDCYWPGRTTCCILMLDCYWSGRTTCCTVYSTNAGLLSVRTDYLLYTNAGLLLVRMSTCCKLMLDCYWSGCTTCCTLMLDCYWSGWVPAEEGAGPDCTYPPEGESLANQPDYRVLQHHLTVLFNLYFKCAPNQAT